MDEFADLVQAIRAGEEPLVELYEEMGQAAGSGVRRQLAGQMLSYQRFQMACIDLLEGEVPDSFECFGQITDDDVNVREGAGPRHRLLARLSRGTPVIVMKREGNWIQIQMSDGSQGYAFKDYVESRLS